MITYTSSINLQKTVNFLEISCILDCGRIFYVLKNILIRSRLDELNVKNKRFSKSSKSTI
jgi:hypothetical protein